MQKKILIIDDESDICEFLSYNLMKANYNVQTAFNGKIGVEKAISFVPDLILLDVMMPEQDGIETCIELRQNPIFKNTIIIFLSARSEEFSQMAAYNAGANDYVVKMIKPNLLVSKVNALLQLSANNIEQSSVIKIGNLEIDKNNFRVLVNGTKPLLLPKKEFELLYLLASNTQKVFSREEILSKIWGKDVIVGQRTIDVHIRRLREKLGDDMIQTLKGIGYKLVFENEA